MDYESVLMLIRATLHLCTFLLIASYKDDGAKYRLGVSVLALGIAAPSLAMAFRIAVNWDHRVLSPPQVIEQTLMTIFVAAIFSAVAVSRGNVATLLPRRVWSHRP